MNRRDLFSTALGLAAAHAGSSAVNARELDKNSSFLSLLRPPDYACAYAGLDQPIPLTASSGNWKGRDIIVTTEPQRHGSRSESR